MKKLKLRRKTIHHIASVFLLLVIALVGALLFPNVFFRTWEAVRDFGISVAFYFVNFFKNPEFTCTVTTFPKYLIETFPQEWANFVGGMQIFGELFISPDHLLSFLNATLLLLYNLSQILLFAIPFLVAGYFLFRFFLKRKSNDVDKVSRPLRAYLSFRRHVLLPIKARLLRFGSFFKKRKAYWIPALVIAAFFLNFGTILLEAISFYLYFLWTFDVGNLYVQILKLLSDLAPIFLRIPVWILVIAALVILDKLRKRRAYKRLNNLEERNREFIKTLPIVTMINGTMGKGKTTLSTDIARSMEVLFREEAKERLTEIDLEFPNFPWPRLEKFINRAVRHHAAYNLASVSNLMKLFRQQFEEKDPAIRRKILRRLKRRYGYRYNDPCFGYDQSFKLEHDDGLTVDELFQAIETYALLYFIYSLQTSLIISNYAIRSDRFLDTEGQFPQYNDDFFDRPSARVEESNLSHIIHFDSLRLGTKKKEDNPYRDAFEFGVVVITEIGKERGNRNDMEGVKKDSTLCNQKNDMFNAELKLIRHSATVDNFPFVRFVTDEQRPENWGADARDLCYLQNIDDVSDKKIILPFFFFEEALHMILSKFFFKLYEKYRYNRSDQTLLLYFLKSIFALENDHYKRIENRFSVKTVRLSMQAGTQDGKIQKIKYFLCTKKAYANTFSTDCYSDFFKQKAARSDVGLLDMPTFRDVKPSIDELSSMESHFMNSVIDVFNRDGATNDPVDPKKRIR